MSSYQSYYSPQQKFAKYQPRTTYDISQFQFDKVQQPKHNIEPSSYRANTTIKDNSILMQDDNPELDEEFDFFNLGIDLYTADPLIPYLLNPLSEAPMSAHYQFPTSTDILNNTAPYVSKQRISKFDDEVLFFIFYVQTMDEAQAAAAAELRSRGYSFDQTAKTWSDKSGRQFDIEAWKWL